MSSNTGAINELFEKTSLGAPDNAVGFVLWRVVHRYIRDVDRVLAPLDLTHLQFTTLILVAWLSRTDGAVTQARIAGFGDIHPMQVSQMLKALQGKDMVARARNAADTRANRVEVTTAGLKALRRALPAVIGVQRRLFGAGGGPGGTLLTELLRIESAERSLHSGA